MSYMPKAPIRIRYVMYLPLVILASQRLDYSLWFDEAAVLQNASEFNLQQAIHGLNWLQSIPPLYFVLVKLFLQVGLSAEAVRVLSLIAILIALEAMHSICKIESKNYLTKILFVCFTINPIILQYATLAKPYAFEFMIVSLGVLFLLRSQKKYFLILVMIGLPLSTTAFVGLLSTTLGFLVIRREKFYFISALAIIGLTGILALFTPRATRELFERYWFGDFNYSILIRLKQGIGNVLNFSASPFGVVSEATSKYTIYFVSIVAFLVIFFSIRSKVPQIKLLAVILLISIVTSIFLQGVMQYPAAGRLLLGIGGVFWCLIFQLGNNQRILQLILLFALLFNFTSDPIKYFQGEPRNGLKTALEKVAISADTQVYADLDNIPALQFYLKNNPNISKSILYVRSQNLFGLCKNITLPKGALLFVNTLKPNQGKNLRLITNVRFSHSSTLFVYRVNSEIGIKGDETLKNSYWCKFRALNPRY
jgi:hypothetical protein